MASNPNDDIPFDRLETLFLDVGNTLVTMHYEWIADELAQRGVTVALERLQRAEAAARPVVSRALRDRAASTESSNSFELYLGTTIENLGVVSRDEAARLAADLVPVFKGPDRDRLWSRIIPGVPEALEQLKGMGLELAVVSNSDGSIERVLERLGLTEHLTEVFDSHVVGYEKPDPRFFLHALEATGAEGETTLHLGDLYDADVVGGRAAGVHAALVDPYDDWPNVDCYRTPSLPALTARLEEARS